MSFYQVSTIRKMACGVAWLSLAIIASEARVLASLADSAAPMAVKALRYGGLAENQTVTVRGTVTALSGWKNSFFLQDDTGSISIDRLDETRVHEGDQVVVEGKLRPGYFAPLIISSSVRVISTGGRMPRPQTPAYEELTSGRFDSSWIEVRGVIHSAKIETVWERQVLLLSLRLPGGSISVHVLDYAGLDIDSLVDSTVTVRGVCGTKFNDRRQMIGLRLFAPAGSDITIQIPAPDPAGIVRSEISQVRQFSMGNDSVHRVRMVGILTYQSGEHGLYLQENGAAVHLHANQPGVFRIGERLEALGFLHNFGYSPGLEDATLHRLGTAPGIKPISVEPGNVIATKDGFRTTGYDGLLVRMSATVLEQIPNSQNQVWLLKEGNVVFQAELSGGVNSSDRASFEAKSKVNIVGICMAEVDDNGFPASFRILLRSPHDISIAESRYSSGAAILILLASFILLLCGGAALWYLERIYRANSETVLVRIPLQELLSRFELGSKVLSRSVLFLAVFSLAVFPHVASAQDDVVGSIYARIALALAALAVWLNRQRGWKGQCSILCSFLVAGIACIPLWQNATTQVAIPCCFCVFGLGLLLLRNARLGLFAQLLFITVSAVSILNLAAWLYSASPSYGVARHTAIAPALAACLLLLATAALCSRPTYGLMKTISSPGFGGLVCRRLLPAALFIPTFIGWVRLQGQLLGFYDTLWGLALFATANVFSFDGIIWASATILNRLDLARTEVEEKLRERDSRLELLFEKTGIGDYTWDIQNDSVRYHPIIRQLYGVDEFETQGSADWFRTRQHPDDAAMIAHELKSAIDNKKPLDIEFRVVLPDAYIRWISCRGNVIYDAAGAATHIHGLNIDVTARKNSEAAVQKGIEAVREADQQMRTALEFAKVPVWSWIIASNALIWTGPVEAIYGKSAQQLTTYLQFREIVHADDLEALEAKLSHCLMSGTEYQSQFRIIVAGETRWLASRGDVLRDGADRIYGMSGVSFDITATKIAEQRLIESEASFRELADAMPQIVWTSDAAGQPQYLNKQWYAYTGSSTIQERFQFLHPDDVETVSHGLQLALQTQSSFECEIRLKRARDNSYRWHLTRALPVFGEDGKILRWYGTSTDIEDFKQARMQVQSLNTDLERRVEERSAELAESELRYRLLVEGVKDYAILLLDAEGRVKSWNQGAELLTGYKTQEILGQHFSVFYSAVNASAGEPEQCLSQAVQEDRSHSEGWRRRQNGSEFWAGSVTTSIWDSNRQVCGFSTVMRDMTEQRRAETLLSERAESATQAKNAFLASVSHEIRTPMNAILGMADMLWESDLSAPQRHYVEIFRRAGRNLLTLINDILDLSKIESGNFSLEAIDFSMSALVEQVIEILKPKAESKAIGLRTQLASSSMPPVVGDPLRLQQVLLNLVGNAIKFTDTGEVLLRVECQSSAGSVTVKFDVCDTGIGIPSHKLETIFEDFEQAETSTNRRFGGTGLGLGISRRLVSRMQGHIRAQSEMGKGSTFSFQVTLPVGKDRNTLDLPQLEEIDGKRVLIVDNNSADRIILREMCAGWGMQVSDCGSGAGALAMIRASASEQPFALALVDELLPDMEGFETAGQMRNLSPATAIFMMSSDSGEANLARCRELGFAGHLTKPVRRGDLLEQVVKVSGSTQDRSAEALISLAAQAGINPGKRVLVLVAEDSEDNRFLLQVYCEGTPYELIFVEDGEQAIAAYRSRSFELIVMDVQMPVMDGLTATREIRALEATSGAKRVPILALTANALPGDVKRAREAGCDAHLSKPISKKHFLAGLAHWLAASAQPDQPVVLSPK